MLKMRKILGISLVLLFLLSVTVSAVSAYSVKDDHSGIRAAKALKPTKAKLFVDIIDGSYGYHNYVEKNSNVILVDMSTGGKAEWKKWYANNKIISYTSEDTYVYKCTKTGRVVFYLKAANSANMANNGKASVSETFTVYVYDRY